MQCDELIWKTIAFEFCSFKVKTDTQNFCRNEFNVSGLCSRQSCPLANSRYATIREQEGSLYLYVKTIERAHTPAKLWEKIKLSKNYAKAIQQIDDELQYWPEFMIHKNKQRLTKLTQVLIRSRRLLLKNTPKLIGVNKKIDRREASREQKAEKAARLEQTIEKELLERLKKGVYGDGIVNESSLAFEKAMDELEEYDEQELELEDDLDREFVSDFSDESDIEGSASGSIHSSDSDSDSDSDSERPKKKRAHVKIEYEQEMEPQQQYNF